MQNVAPTHRLNRRSRDFLIAAAVVFLIGAALAVAGISLHVFSLVVPSNRGFAVYDLTRKSLMSLGAGVAFISMLMALRAVSWKTDNALAWQLGELLAQELDRQFVFIRNISERSLGYIDAALVSKHGVLVLRITKRKGEYYNVGGGLAAARPQWQVASHALESHARRGGRRDEAEGVLTGLSIDCGARFRRCGLYARRARCSTQFAGARPFPPSAPAN